MGKPIALVEGWRKLSRMGKSPTRVISIPSRTLSQLGIDPTIELRGMWVVNGDQLILKVEEANAHEGNQNRNWNKLVRMTGGQGRVISLPGSVLRSLALKQVSAKVFLVDDTSVQMLE